MVIGLSRATTSSLAYRLAAAPCHCRHAFLTTRPFTTSPRSDAARNEYQETLNLPKTAFAMRANAAARDHLFARRANADLYRWQRANLPATNEWHLQDGPPYANGELHMGHALNKILKDIVNRYQVLRGRRVLYKPGWDTHGLPIELKVFSQPELKGVTTRGADPLLVRSLARRFAQSQVDKQREEFREFGIMADWQETYQTFDAEYQSKQLDVFARMVEKGLVYRAHRPVYFSPTTRTALAEAELEYNDAHRARSVFVRFPLSDVGQSLRGAVKDDPPALEALQSGKVDAIVWTTTPWSLPGNMALAVNADLSYSLVRSESHGYLVVATNRIEHLSSRKAGTVDESTKSDARSEIGYLESVATFDGSALLDSGYRHPFLPEDQPTRPILAADYVTDDSGTGLVHTAPAHGLDDYHLCVKHGVTGGSSSTSASSPAMLVPVDLDGRFTSLVSSLNPTASSLVGASALEKGSPLIISWLESRGSLLGEHRITHRYPYDWRSKRPVMMLATDQWFVDVGPLKTLAREALQRVEFVPESKSARERLAKIIESRTEWCISRQRAWGVPLPVVYAKEDGEPLMTPENVRHIAQVLREKGADYWWQGEAEEFVAPQYREVGKQWVLGRDTLDVWFDSGVSWLASGARPTADEAASIPADLYLEGTDQHRGWFQSSLLTRLAYDDSDGTSPPSAPFRRIATHGFVLNAQGEKMSKSLNNWLGPMPFIKGGTNKSKEPAWGSDVLRFWAAGVSAWGEDARVSWLTVQHAGEAMRKLRNTLRFLLANLSSSTPEQERPSLSSASVRDSLTLLDKHVLSSLVSLSQECQGCYDALDYPGVVRRLSHFATTTLSNVYFAVVKDTLYADGSDSGRRQAALAVCEEALRTLTSALAPIAPNLAEEAWHYRQGATQDPPAEIDGDGEPSFFHEGWREVREAKRWQGTEGDARPKGLKLLEVRDAVLKLVADRPKEEAGGSSAAYDVVLKLPSEGNKSATAEVLHALSSEELAETFIVADVEVRAVEEREEGTVIDGVSVSIRPTRKTKCPRCWRFAVPVAVEEGTGAAVCPRCADVLKHHRRGQ